MTQGERIKLIRKSLNLTLEKFGEKLGVGKTAISKIEKGENNLTDQMSKLICREYSVDYVWLTTGEGSMFIENDEAFSNKIDEIMRGENESRRNLFKALAYASDDEIEAIEKIIDYFVDLKEKGKSTKLSFPFNGEVATATGTDNITSEPHIQQTDASDTATTVEDAEAAYIKSISENAHRREQSVSFISNAITPTGTDGSN